MKNIKVRGCIDCPFYYVDVDYDAVGYPYSSECLLKRHENNTAYTDYHIEVWDDRWDDSDEERIPTTPEWCPLDKEGVKIEKA